MKGDDGFDFFEQYPESCSSSLNKKYDTITKNCIKVICLGFFIELSLEKIVYCRQIHLVYE